MASSSANRFGGGLSEELHLLANDGQARAFPAGHVIFSAGDPGDGFYFVQSGRVRISATVDHHEPRVLAMIAPGDFFGEMAVIDDAPRSATAIAETETTTTFFDRAQLLQLLERRPELALSLIREFSVRMRALNQKYIDEMIQAERLAAVGRFAGTIVHDFKNPLTVISMAAELACLDTATPDLRHKSQQRIAHQIGRMTNMLHELIEFTQPSGRKINPPARSFAAFMQPLAEELTGEMAARRVAVVLPAAPPDLPVRIDPQRLSRLFYNLFNNAADEMRDGGTIFLRFLVSDTALRIEVEDTGQGISPEIAPSLFQPFATHGKAHGTGLGLSICKKIVEDHGGQISATSAPGKGATFSFTLPLPR